MSASQILDYWSTAVPGTLYRYYSFYYSSYGRVVDAQLLNFKFFLTRFRCTRYQYYESTRYLLLQSHSTEHMHYSSTGTCTPVPEYNYILPVIVLFQVQLYTFERGFRLNFVTQVPNCSFVFFCCARSNSFENDDVVSQILQFSLVKHTHSYQNPTCVC